MCLAIAPADRKPCVLEGAQPGAADFPAQELRPCALLCAEAPGTTAPSPAAPVPAPVPAPREDESADPVGDGHSDAEWADRHPKGD